MYELNTLAMNRNETFNITFQYPKFHQSMENGESYYHNRHHQSHYNGRNQVSIFKNAFTKWSLIIKFAMIPCFQYHWTTLKANPDDPYKAILNFGDRQYVDVRLTVLEAKHDAATR